MIDQPPDEAQSPIVITPGWGEQNGRRLPPSAKHLVNDGVSDAQMIRSISTSCFRPDGRKRIILAKRPIFGSL